jgi:NAD(P) transhydrogenase subunit beta
MSAEWINATYIVAAALFIFGLKQLSSPATAVRGNLLSAVGMLLAVLVTMVSREILEYQWILAAMLVGGVVSLLVGRRSTPPATPLLPM